MVLHAISVCDIIWCKNEALKKRIALHNHQVLQRSENIQVIGFTIVIFHLRL